MRTVVEKCSQQVALQLLEVVDVALYCLDHELLKKRNLLMEVLPSLARYVYTYVLVGQVSTLYIAPSSGEL